MATFEELGLREELLRAVGELGFEQAMPIQEKTIPFLLDKENNTTDLVALAQTGTGKTAAFGLPTLHLTDTSKKAVQTLVLSPTRELCIQIANDLKKFSKYMEGMKVVAVYGGESIVNQFRQLDVQPQILVATPGRLIDLLDRSKVDLSQLQTLILDEADEMLNMGFKDDIERILEETPEDRRTLLFSATMPKEIANIAKKYMKDSTEIAVGKKNSGSENVQHLYYVVQTRHRYAALKRIVDMNPSIYSIIFCRTRQETKDVADLLMRDGYNSDALHGDLTQAQRDLVMQRFRDRTLQILVATDVAARGLDVSDLTHVINYNLPDDIESYTHRSGRTGRANKTGVSIAIIQPREKGRIRDIERIINKKFERAQVPTGVDVCKIQLAALFERLRNVEVNDEQIAPFANLIMEETRKMDQDTFIRHFVAMNFNRFLKYYDGAEDLNAQDSSDRRRDGRDGGRDGGRDRGKKRGGERIRLKINRGEDNQFTPKSVLSLINDATNDRDIDVHGIAITPRYSFFDVYKEDAPRIIEAFNSTYDDITIAEATGGRKYGEDGKRGDRRRDDHGDRRDRRDDRRDDRREGKFYDKWERGDRGGKSGRKEGDRFSHNSEHHNRSFRRNK
ncbi:MAG: DEAD/DEAH box helicase [Paludibacteraceae bacterium]|nr:DEAD/DEAH box helicase [Paludibacteraceae bacterium]